MSRIFKYRNNNLLFRIYKKKIFYPKDNIEIQNVHRNLISIKRKKPNNDKIFHCYEDELTINSVYECDGVMDCLSGEDERNCQGKEKLRYTCLESNEKVHFSLLCDYIPDCSDKSDEEFCCKVT